MDPIAIGWIVIITVVLTIAVCAFFSIFFNQTVCCICNEVDEEKLIGFDFINSEMPTVRITSQRLRKADRRICKACLQAIKTNLREV